ncbi:hypothetical protein HZS_663 [Henneguya salminicola]|nr:hypothetical protein HZS_663 [Henneguya salminicola]
MNNSVYSSASKISDLEPFLSNLSMDSSFADQNCDCLVNKFKKNSLKKEGYIKSHNFNDFDVPCPEKYVGYADLPNQIYRHCAMNGFDFNLLVVGESGLGKSTFINNMFCSSIYVNAKYPEKYPPFSGKTMEIRSSTITILENDVPLRLTLIDTPGFGDSIDNSSCWEKITKFVDAKNLEYLDWENSLQRSTFQDTRVHCCLYFISPTGHRLKPIDIEFLQKLQDKTNVIPIIGRSDSLTFDDLREFKKRISEDIKHNEIQIYDFQKAISNEIDEKDLMENYLSRVPFAVVTSNYTAEVGGKTLRCRKYPWGICEGKFVAYDIS